jgi:2-polyprenyl-3-methyl-5-hydroxy-6-metoxy-1,4-benzoquinol methylase
MLWDDLKDKLFGAPGQWKLQRCNNSRCRSIWMNPVIVESELHKAYANYYTHTDAPAGANHGVARPAGLRLLYERLIKQNYWALRYGYGGSEVSAWSKLCGYLVYLVPHKSFYLDTHVMYLQAVKEGRVLDVGCGNGERLALLKQLGWTVKGIDIDRQAVEAARQKGVDADCGELKVMPYPASSFDAVILSHVIEHVPQPVELLSECARVLKPGGRLVMLTPNAESLGLDFYGRCWRGLEPPRHLQIFSRPALERIVKEAGLSVVKGQSLVGPQVLYASHLIKTGATGNNGAARLSMAGKVFVKGLALMESLMLWLKPDRGEILAVIATK